MYKLLFTVGIFCTLTGGLVADVNICIFESRKWVEMYRNCQLLIQSSINTLASLWCRQKCLIVKDCGKVKAIMTLVKVITQNITIRTIILEAFKQRRHALISPAVKSEKIFAHLSHFPNATHLWKLAVELTRLAFSCLCFTYLIN